MNGILIDGSHLKGKITLSNKIKKINDYAFSDNTELTSITIPDSVTIIGKGAFEGQFDMDCTSEITNVLIPNSVTAIDEYAFENCTKLTSLIIPDSVRYIGRHAFGSEDSNISVTLPDDLIYYEPFIDLA